VFLADKSVSVCSHKERRGCPLSITNLFFAEEMLQAISSTLAPDTPPVIAFRRQWNEFLRFYAENKPLGHKSQPVEKTHLAHHLQNMLKLLLKEQQERKELQKGELLPCMEFLIRHQVLDVLSSICQADSPPGIRPHIFNFFTFLTSRVKQAILPYVNVYHPMRRLLMISAMSKASPTESQELAFITSLVTKLSAETELLSLFAHHARAGEDVSHCSSRRYLH